MALLLAFCAGGARACKRVEFPGGKVALTHAAVLFRGTALQSEVLPQHLEMRGRARYSVTFRVNEYWKGTPALTLKLYHLASGTDCMGGDCEVGKEYLHYASEEGARDLKMDDFFWSGWTDVIPQGKPMLQPIEACIPGGETTDPAVRAALLDLGKGVVPPKR